MQGNWFILFLLVVAVVGYALVQAGRKPKDEDGEDGETPEDAQREPPGNPEEGDPPPEDEGGEPPEDAPPEQPEEPEEGDLPQAEGQERLSDASLPERGQAECPPGEEMDLDPGVTPEVEVEPVPEPRPSANAAIRRRAWQLFRENYRKILPLSAIVAVASVALTCLQSVVPENLRFLSLAGNALEALFAPLTLAGAAYAALRVWRGEAPHPRLLARFLRKPLFLRAAAVALIGSLLVLLPSALLYAVRMGLLALVPSDPFAPNPAGVAFAFINLAGQIAILWLQLRAALVHFALAGAPDQRALQAFKAGFRATKGHLGRVMGMQIVTGWPFYLAPLLLLLIWSPRALPPQANAWVELPLYSAAAFALSGLLSCFYGGYFMLSMAGLAGELLPPAPEDADPGDADQTE